MSETTPSRNEEESLADFLLAYDAALATGVTPPAPTPRPAGAPDAEIVARLASARDCLSRLHRLWPWPGADPDGGAELSGLDLKFGRYVLRGILGRGGHGVVFRAYDPSLDREVALKMPRPESPASAELRRLVLREARAVARLDHPGVVPIHDIGDTGPVCYIATALVEGPDLSRWLVERGSRIEPREAATILLALAEALAHAHGRGVIHRDLKPGNILMETRHADGERPTCAPRLVDFGLARILDEAGDETRTVAPAVGTPRYMAPEQFFGPRDRVGPKTDLYGLGAVLHTMLFGSPPEAASVKSADLPGREIPPDLAAILVRCLQADPDARHPDGESLAEDLRRFLRGEPISIPRRGGVSRRDAMFGIGTVAAGAILAVAAVRRWSTPRMTADGLPIHEAYRILKHPKGEIYHVRFARNGRVLASAGEDGTARLWSVESGAPLATIDLGEEVAGVDWSPDDRFLAAVCGDGRLHLWDLETLKPVVAPRSAHPGGAVCARFSPNGRHLYTAGRDGVVLRWPSHDASSPDRERRVDGIVECLEVARDGSFVAVGSGVNGSACALTAELELRTRWTVPLRHSPVRKVFSLDVFSDPSIVIVVGASDQIFLCYLDGGMHAIGTGMKGGNLWSVVGTPRDGRIAAAGGGDDPTIRLFETGAANAPVAAFHGHTDRIWGLAVSPDGRLMASACRDGTARLWRLPAGS